MVKIIGQNATADRTRAFLAEGDVHHTDHQPLFTFRIFEKAGIDCPIVDGVDSPLEQRFVDLLTEVSPAGRVVLQRRGGNLDDRVLVVTVPASDSERHAVALAILRTCLQLIGRRRRWLPAWLGLGVLLVASSAFAGETGSMSARTEAAFRATFEQVTGGTVDQGQGGISPWTVQFSAPQHIICDGGTCGGASAFNDNSAFTAGASAVNPIGCVFNDSITDLTSGSAGAPRCTAKRGIHVNFRDSSGVEIGTAGNPFKMNVTMFGGSAVVTGIGASGAGIPRMSLSNDSQAIVTTAVKGATPAGSPTSTAASGARQPLDVTLYTSAGVAYRADQIRSLTSSGDSVSTLTFFDNSNAATSTAWTSATAVDTARTIVLGNTASLSLVIDATGAAFSAGQLNVEATSNGSVWAPVKLSRADTLATDSTFSLNGFAATQAWNLNTAGYTQIRVRLNPAITGSGTLTLLDRTTETIAPVNVGPLPTSLGGNGGIKVDFAKAVPYGSVSNAIGVMIVDPISPTDIVRVSGGGFATWLQDSVGNTITVATVDVASNARGVAVRDPNAVGIAASTAAISTHQTDGTEKAIVRGGQKGATNTNADITHTAEGADHEAIDVQLYSAGVAKDPTQIRTLNVNDIVSASPLNAQANILSITANGQNVSAGVLQQQYGVVIFQIAGSWTGTLTFQAKNASGAALVAVAAVNIVTGASSTTTTANGSFAVPAAGMYSAQVTSTAWTSGQADISAGLTALASAVYEAVPINVGSSTLPTGAATEATLAAIAVSVASIDAKTPTLGPKLPSPFRCNALRKTNCSS